jgi:hypothetical protein
VAVEDAKDVLYVEVVDREAEVEFRVKMGTWMLN